MPTLPMTTISRTIEASFDRVVAELADLGTHHEWATEFFDGPARPVGDGTWTATVPRMGGDVRVRVDADPTHGVVDLSIAPAGRPFGPPLPVRVLRNGDGVDVLFTLHRFPGTDDDQWAEGIASMARELEQLRDRLEA